MTIYKRNYELEKAANAFLPINEQFDFDCFHRDFMMKHSDIFKLTIKDALLYKVKKSILSLLECRNEIYPDNLLGVVGVMYYEQDTKNVVLELYFYVYNEEGIYSAIEPYNFMLEKKAGISRCWTLKYADNAAGIGFHIDILPSIPENETTKISRGTPDAISIIDNKAGVYTWTPSNPKGFIDWFDNKNTEFRNMLFNEATVAMGRAAHVDIEEIEKKSKRSPLRQTIKLLKNHRDKAFKDNKTFAPKSILITTLATHLYRKERDLSSAVYNILEGLSKYSFLMKEGFISNNTNMIYREADGTWVVKNPALSTENFIEDWGKSSNSEYAKAFFNWVSSLKYDLERIMNQPNKTELINKSFNMKSAVFRDITEKPLRTPSITTHQSQPWGC